MTAKTSRKVTRPTKPKPSANRQTATKAAKGNLTTLRDRQLVGGRAVLIHGLGGVGKTTLAIHKAPRPVLTLDIDKGLDSVYGTTNMDKIHIWQPANREEYTWEDLDNFRNYVKAGDWELPYKTIVPDNLTVVQKPLIAAVISEMIEKGGSDEDGESKLDPDNPSQQGWGKSYRRFDKWIRDVRDAKSRGVHVIFTSGTGEWMDESEGYSRMMPDIEGKERNQVATHMDAVCFLENDEDGRRLHMAPSGSYITKVRLPIALHGQVPDAIEDPDFNKMMAAVEIIKEVEAKAKTATTRKKATRRKQ